MTGRAWELIRAVRGPILLMTFGGLMALNHTDKAGFERTWPVLIIVYGLCKLMERMAPRPIPPPWPPPGAPPPAYTPSTITTQPSQGGS